MLAFSIGGLLTKVLPFPDPQCKLKITPCRWVLSLAFGFQVLHYSLPKKSPSLSSAFKVPIAQYRQIHSHFLLTSNKFILTFWPFRHSWPRPNLHSEKAFQLIRGHSASNCTYCEYCSQFWSQPEKLCYEELSQRWSGVHSAPVTHCWNSSEL